MTTIPIPDLNTQKMIIEMGQRIEELEGLLAKEKVKTTLSKEFLEHFTSEKFKVPSYKEVRILKEDTGLSGADMANICGTTPRNVRAWMSEEEAANARRIPYSAWRLLLIELNII